MNISILVWRKMEKWTLKMYQFINILLNGQCETFIKMRSSIINNKRNYKSRKPS